MVKVIVAQDIRADRHLSIIMNIDPGTVTVVTMVLRRRRRRIQNLVLLGCSPMADGVVHVDVENELAHHG